MRIAIRWAGAVVLLAALLGGCAQQQPPPVVVASNGEWDAEIRSASQRFNVPEEWIRAVMQQESGGRTHWKGGQLITSHAGAMGLMQVMPGTYEELRWRYGFGPDPYDPHDNIHAGAAYIREMYDMFGSPGFLAAYNGGPGRYQGYLDGRRGLPRETERYVEIIAPQIAGVYPGDGGGEVQYAVAQSPLRVQPAPDRIVVAQMAPIPDGSTYSRPTVVAAMEPIPDGSTYGRPTVVAAMAPIPDGSTTARPVIAPAPVMVAAAPVVRPAPVPAAVRMAPIPDRPAAAPVDDILVALAESAPAPAPAPVRPIVRPAGVVMQPIPDRPPVQRGAVPAAAIVTASAGPAVGDDGLPPGWFVPKAPGT